MSNSKFEKISHFKDFSVFIQASEEDIRQRLITALQQEKLLCDETVLEDSRTQSLQSDSPAQLLRHLAESEALAVDATNLDRACAEIEDGITGLARARAGISSRWKEKHEELSSEARSSLEQTPFSTLVAAMLQRCPVADSSALLARCEQLVCDGHPTHPAAKTSLGVGEAWQDVLPEQIESYELRFVAVPQEYVVATGVGMREELANLLPQFSRMLEAELLKEGREDQEVIPVHPFQWQSVIKKEFSQEISDGVVRLLHTTISAEPLMSVRTVRVSDGVGSAHIKLALEVQLTGAVRGISEGAVKAPLISSVVDSIMALDSGFVPRTLEDEPGFNLVRDKAAVRWDANTGIRSHCLGAILREDPARNVRSGDVALPVATLMSRNPLTGNYVFKELVEELSHGSYGETTEFIEEWFTALGRLLFVPASALLGRWGIALEPHPQNVVVVLRDGMPHKVFVRDLGGCRLWSQGPLAEHSMGRGIIDEVAGTALSEKDALRLVDKVFYPLVANLYRNLLDCLSLEKQQVKSISTKLAYLLACEYWRSRAAKFGSESSMETPMNQHLSLVYGRFLGSELPVKRVLGMRLSGAVTEQEYVFAHNPLEHKDFLEQQYLRRKIERNRKWAETRVLNRVKAAAKDEGLSPEDLTALAEDIRNAAENLSLVRTHVEHHIGRHSRSLWTMLQELPSHEAMVAADSLGISGHNVHPLAKLRRGFSTEESVAYGPESYSTVDLRLLAVRRDLVETSAAEGFHAFFTRHFANHVDAAVQELCRMGHNPHEFEIIPVHPWQWEHVISEAYKQEIHAGLIVIIPHVTLAVRPTISLRTAIPHAPSVLGQRPFIKCAVDVVLTSTRRSISQNSALGTPRVAELVKNAVAYVQENMGASRRVKVIPELAGVTLARSIGSTDEAARRGLSILLRDDAANYLEDGEIAISACVLRGHEGILVSPLQELGLDFLRRYTFDLMSTVLGLMCFRGIALEQHLQNTMVRIAFVDGAPVYRGLLLRDFSGLRAYLPRLNQWCEQNPFEPNAITLTDDYEEFINKGFYASVFGNLDGFVTEIAHLHEVDSDDVWEIVRAEIDCFIDALPCPLPENDAQWLRREAMRRKGFLSMGMNKTGTDIYIDVTNPLRDNA
ncbi:IucA/IucC family protein [Corynebacterium silvaticum]|uniref:IucA/IucC family protein n=1 Tax=Corynebacterium silvaticum TaxID=2320431 RepID=A0A7U5K8J1_9CORY|nr:IucA/IucC family protein [Corynebacterium silvaticum]ARU46104.1 IucA/IucC family protein [Corynebacterium silvaticum]MBH5299210.1 IucA/IucC family siderophore biosynthesis protein [Corynebacterium silvaticum]NOM64469.1 siderophore biosynthesis protein [Corynebacterium silvaticum]TFA91430.1 siderophore biosynthesis protein [Corynebacterium silvaticum]TFA96874.1 siderophore biosynthesis protein [Corynebacterium silvaticum]